jgi:hypothetical protein
MINIKIVESPLSDNSIVYDVVACDRESGDLFRFPCYSEKDAIRFATKLAELINDHTTMADAKVI